MPQGFTRSSSIVPEHWLQKPSSISVNELRQKRKTTPDISYDLDGDGVVSQKDYFLAKQFDTDKDGKLDSQEKKKAKKALESGFENKFMFGLERSGLTENQRDQK
jgi:hypothetical protein